MKIKVNDNFTNILNYIRSCDHQVTYYELLMWCIDYDIYKELYQNYYIFKDIILEHNAEVKAGTWTPVM